MRQTIEALRSRLPGAAVYLGALGPQMLRLAGKQYDGAALNWCSADQVPWSREHVAAGAMRAGRQPSDVRIHEYVRVCIDEDEEAARRAEEQQPERWAVALAKALAPPPAAAELCLPLVHTGGAAILWLGEHADLEALATASVQLGGGPPELHNADLGGLAVLPKVAPTPPGFPRRVGVAKKRPLA